MSDQNEPVRSLLLIVEATDHEAIDVVRVMNELGLKFTTHFTAPFGNSPVLRLPTPSEKAKRRSPRFHSIYLDKTKPQDLGEWFATLNPKDRRTMRAFAELYMSLRSGISLSAAEFRKRIGLPDRGEQMHAMGSINVGIMHLAYRAFNKAQHGKDLRLPKKTDRSDPVVAAEYGAAYAAVRARIIRNDGDHYLGAPDIELVIKTILWGLPATELVALHSCLPVSNDMDDAALAPEYDEDEDSGDAPEATSATG